MITQMFKDHLPEWVEAGTIVLTLFIAAIVSASLTLYKVDVIGDDIKEMKVTLQILPVLLERVNKLEKNVDINRKTIYEITTHDLEVHHGG